MENMKSLQILASTAEHVLVPARQVQLSRAKPCIVHENAKSLYPDWGRGSFSFEHNQFTILNASGQEKYSISELNKGDGTL